jgi:hypothetical protein
MRRYVTIMAAALSAGCTTAGADWHNSQISDSTVAERQLIIDRGYCKQVALGAAPMPDIRLPEQQPDYVITGDATTTGPSGRSTTTFQATARPVQGGGFGAGMASGLAQGAALGEAMRTRRDQAEIHRSCMYALRWSDTPS